MRPARRCFPGCGRALALAVSRGRAGRQCVGPATPQPRASNLDEGQRHKLVEPQSLLGLTESLWTPVGVLGFVLAAASCAQLDELDFFKDFIRSVREALA